MKSKDDLYLLVDGTYTDSISDRDGQKRGPNGVPCALKEDGSPMTLQQSAVENKNVMAAEVGKEADAAVESGLQTINEARRDRNLAPLPSDDAGADAKASKKAR